MDEEKRKIVSECWDCENYSTVPGNAHIKCNNPDPEMKGEPHGIKHGWFFYPLLFDPTWKTKLCSNFESKESVSNAVSSTVKSK